MCMDNGERKDHNHIIYLHSQFKNPLDPRTSVAHLKLSYFNNFTLKDF